MSKKTQLFLLAVASLLVSRLVFVFINDPEGPNLVVVLGLAAIIYAVSLVVYAVASRYFAQ